MAAHDTRDALAPRGVHPVHLPRSFEAILLPVNLPIDPSLDRFVLTLFVGSFLLLAVSGSAIVNRGGRRPFAVLILLWAAICLCSVCFNLHELVIYEQVTLAIKRLFVLLCLLAIFFVTALSIRGDEVVNFSKLLVGVACVTAIGTVVQYRAHINYFYSFWQSLSLPGVTVEPAPSLPVFNRPAITGPTKHGLADATILSMALPFALILALDAKRLLARYGYAAACLLIVLGSLATQRKTAVVLPVTAATVVMLLRPRGLRTLALFSPTVLVAAHVAAPGVLGSFSKQLTGRSTESSESVVSRTEDYTQIVPDVLHHLFIGRGYGTYSPDLFRILDNQALLSILEVGVVGTLAYAVFLGYILKVAAGAGRRIKDPALRGFAAAAAGASAAFIVVQVLFDVLAFAAAPYVFMVVAGLLSALIADQLVLESASRPPP